MAVPLPGCPVSYSLLSSPKGLLSERCFEFYKTHRIMWRLWTSPLPSPGFLTRLLSSRSKLLVLDLNIIIFMGRNQVNIITLQSGLESRLFHPPQPPYPPEGPFQVTKLPKSPSMVCSLMEFAGIPPANTATFSFISCSNNLSNSSSLPTKQIYFFESCRKKIEVEML